MAPPPRTPRRGGAKWILVAAVLVVVGGLGILALRRFGTSRNTASSPTTSPGFVPGAAGQVAPNKALLATRVGFGAAVTGGSGGEVVHVTTVADDGPGSLRAATAGNDPRWIVFDGDYTISLTHGIAVGSNKTLDGRGRKVTLTGHGQYGLVLTNSQNVIVENMILRDFGDVARTMVNDPFDAIHVEHSSGVWIDHCDLSTAGDKLISIDAGTTSTTVSWNRFHDQEQVFQIGNQTTRVADATQTVTIHHNFFDRTGYRNPVISYGKVHDFNNYLLAWKTYGMRAERHGQLYSESNIFEAGDNLNATKVQPGGNGCNDKKTRCDDTPGLLRSVNDLSLNGAKIITSQPDEVFDPHAFYAYKADRADEALKSAITSQAGWRPS